MCSTSNHSRADWVCEQQLTAQAHECSDQRTPPLTEALTSQLDAFEMGRWQGVKLYGSWLTLLHPARLTKEVHITFDLF